MAKLPTPQMLVASRPEFPVEDWLDVKPEFTPGSFCYPAKKDTMELLHMPNPHEWDPSAEDWNLPENWEQILCDAFADRLEKHRSLKLFMDICVRCGACADKCHFFLGTNDPKNMPVLRAELPLSIAGTTITRFCASGLQSIAIAAGRVVAEGVDVMLAGGIETISGIRAGNNLPTDMDPWLVEHKPELYMAMIDTADVVAHRYEIGRAHV